jgi:hypothetical protein
MRRGLRRLLQIRFIKRLPTLLVMVAVVVIAVGVGSLVLSVAPGLMSFVPADDTQRGQLGLLLSLIGFALGIGTGLMALIELAENTDSRNMQIYRDIYERFMSQQQSGYRRILYTMDVSTDARQTIEALRSDPDRYIAFKETLNLIDYVGFLVEQDWVTADELIGWISPIVVKVWEKIGAIVEYEASQRPEEPDYYDGARKLAPRCERWRNANLSRRRKAIVFDENRL